ncbi:MAG TPA: DUF3352 domain-containing protein [Pirellulaceae bacterium]|nr:DUF3352 domain-containing protein [Pirellulaceae bacterium]
MNRRLECLGCLLLVLIWTVGKARAAEKSAGELLPASVVAYVEVPQPAKVLDVVFDHPLARQLQQQPEYKAAQQTPQYEQLQAAIQKAEGALGQPWRKAAAEIGAGGLFFGVDLTTRGVVALAAASSEAQAAKGRDAILELSRASAASIKENEHRGVKVHEIGDAGFAAVGNWLVASNKRALVWQVIDNHQGHSEPLAGDEQFQSVLKARTGQPAAWLYADLRLLKLIPGFRQAIDKKSDNPPVELLAGGIIGSIPDAPYVTAALDLNPAGVKLKVALPCKPNETAKKREFYLGGEARGVAPPLLRPQRTLLSAATYRDFASLWRHAPDLFDDGINAKFAEAESNLTTLFAGRNFREDILGNLHPGMRLVVTRQEFPPDGITPAIKLPAGAIVVRMKSPEETAKIFKITFQSVVGFLNVTGGMNGIDPLDLNSEKVGSALIVSGEYLPPRDAAKRKEAPLHYNASPAAAFVGDLFILSSSRALAVELAEQVQREAPASAGVNSSLVLDAAVGQAALADNRGPLIAQNMLEKGHDRAAAEQEIDRVLALLKNLQRSSLQLAVKEAGLELTLEVLLASQP